VQLAIGGLSGACCLTGTTGVAGSTGTTGVAVHQWPQQQDNTTLPASSPEVLVWALGCARWALHAAAGASSGKWQYSRMGVGRQPWAGAHHELDPGRRLDLVAAVGRWGHRLRGAQQLRLCCSKKVTTNAW
jgi:hypothetical protein